MERHERIAKAIEISGKKKGVIAAECGVAPAAVSQWLSGESKSMKPENLFALALATGFSPKWLAIGEGPERDASTLATISAWDDETPLDEDEIAVPLLKDVQVAAGTGRVAEDFDSGKKIRLGKLTLRNQGVQFDKAVCVTVTGNSMEPALPDGSTVGVNLAATAIKDGKVYVIRHDGELRVKQVFRKVGGGIRLRSFNMADHPEEEYSQEDMDRERIEVIGKVFWSSVLWD